MQGSDMTAYRAVWFEAFRDFVQFYPKLSASIAFGSMAAAGRIMANSRPAREGADKGALVRKAAVPAALPITTRVRKAHKSVKHPARKAAKRMSGRRKAA
jgi:hypothetical protein